MNFPRDASSEYPDALYRINGESCFLARYLQLGGANVKLWELQLFTEKKEGHEEEGAELWLGYTVLIE